MSVVERELAPQTDPLEEIPVREIPHREEALEILRKARTFLDRPWGWCKGQFAGRSTRYGDTPYCAIGAIRVAGHGSPLNSNTVPAEIVAMKELANAAYLRSIGDIIFWNDSKRTHKKDVSDAFDRAILSLEEG